MIPCGQLCFYQSYPVEPNKAVNILQISHGEYFLADWRNYNGTHVVTIEGRQYEVTGQVTKSMTLFTGQINGEDMPVKVSRDYNKVTLFAGPYSIMVRILPAIADNLIKFIESQ